MFISVWHLFVQSSDNLLSRAMDGNIFAKHMPQVFNHRPQTFLMCQLFIPYFNDYLILNLSGSILLPLVKLWLCRYVFNNLISQPPDLLFTLFTDLKWIIEGSSVPTTTTGANTMAYRVGSRKATKIPWFKAHRAWYWSFQCKASTSLICF